MPGLYPILFLLACGTLYLHLRLVKWNSKYKSLCLALNLIFPLVYVPVLMNLWWSIKTLSNAWLPPALVDRIIYAIMALTLFGCHYYYASRLKAIELPRGLARLFWPSFLLPVLCFLNIVVIRAELFSPANPLHLQLYLRYITISTVLSMLSNAVYLAFFIYVGIKVERKLGEFAKMRAWWRRFAMKYFYHGEEDGKTG